MAAMGIDRDDRPLSTGPGWFPVGPPLSWLRSAIEEDRTESPPHPGFSDDRDLRGCTRRWWERPSGGPSRDSSRLGPPECLQQLAVGSRQRTVNRHEGPPERRNR